MTVTIYRLCVHGDMENVTRETQGKNTDTDGRRLDRK